MDSVITMANEPTQVNIDELNERMNLLQNSMKELSQKPNKSGYDLARLRNAELFGEYKGQKSLSEDGRRQIKYLTDTTRASTGVATLLPEFWSKKIIFDAAAERQFEPWAMVDKTLVNTPAKDINIPIETDVTFTNNNTEAGEATEDECDSEESKQFTPAIYRYHTTISYEAVKQTAINKLQSCRRQLTKWGTNSVDSGIALACANAAEGDTAGYLYGGVAAGVEDLNDGDILTPRLFSKARGLVKRNKWKNEPGTNRQFVMFIGTEQEEELIDDSQFTNASEYGSQQVVTTGEIGEYKGAKTVVSNNIPTKNSGQADYTEGQNWGADGNVCIFAKGQVSFGIAYAEMPNLKTEFYLHANKYRLYHYSLWDADFLQGGSMALVKVANEV